MHLRESASRDITIVTAVSRFLQGISSICWDHLPWRNFWQLSAAGEAWLLEAFASISSDSQLLAVPGFGGTYTSCFQLAAAQGLSNTSSAGAWGAAIKPVGRSMDHTSAADATAITAKRSRNSAEKSLSLLIYGVSLPKGTVSSTWSSEDIWGLDLERDLGKLCSLWLQAVPNASLKSWAECILTSGRRIADKTLNYQVKKLWEKMSWLHSTRVYEQNIDGVFRETSQKQEPKLHNGCKDGQLETVLRGGVDGLPWWRMLEMYVLCQQEEVFSACTAAVIEQAQCPGNRQRGTKIVRAGVRARWAWNRVCMKRKKWVRVIQPEILYWTC